MGLKVSEVALEPGAASDAGPSSDGGQDVQQNGLQAPTTLEEALAQIAQLQFENARLSSRSAAKSTAADDGGGGVMTMAEYFKTPIWKHLRIRMPWLLGLFLLQSFSSSIMHGFEEILQGHLVVATFVPMLLGAGGNAGNQLGIIVIAALSKEREFIHENISTMLRTEGTIALIEGTTLGLFGFGRVMAEYPDHMWSALSIAVATTLVVLVSVFLGIGFSIGLDRLKLDPAAGSVALLTTVADMLGVTMLCLCALAILGSQGDEPQFCEHVDKCSACILNETAVE